MSSVNFIDKLLDGVEVEWKALGTVIKTVTAPSKLKSQAYRATGRLPIVDQGIEYIAGYTDEDITPVEAGEYVIFGDHSEHIKYVDFPFVQGADGLKILSPLSANAKYIYHAFLNFYTKELSYKRHWSTAQQTLIPIPCPDNPKRSLEIQAEIVRILDAFNELTAELTAELTDRKKQYNFYRDKLLSFDEGAVEWKVLGALTTIKTGQSVNKQIISANPGEYAVINSGREPLGYMNVWNTDDDPIGITSRGAGVGSITWRNGKYFRGNLNYSVTIKNKKELTTRYLYHVLQKMQMEIQALCTFDGIPALNAGSLKELQVPVPAIAKQECIAAILDKFDALTNSLAEGLPYEIELRQKQYEYYRNLLLGFPKPEEVEA